MFSGWISSPQRVIDSVRTRLHLAVLVPVLGIAAVLRLYDLGHGHPGLAIYTSISSHAYKSFHNWLYPNMFADGSILADKPPLFFWYQGIFIALLGHSNVAYRLPVAIAGICSVVLVYVIVRRRSGTTPALIATAALAVMPLDVNYSRATFIEPVTTVTMLLSAYFVVRAVQERREGFYYLAAFILGLAFMVKLWQGLLPAPAFALLALLYRWQPWGALARTGAISVCVFLVSAFWWPVLVWLTPGAYVSIMHSDNIWDMIFGWNLLERYGELEYGARHRQDILWFVTGPMSIYFGVSLFPATAVGALAVILYAARRAAKFVGRLGDCVANRVPSLWRFVSQFSATEPDNSRAKDGVTEDLQGIGIGVLWLLWLGVAVVGFGGASIRLATYWAAATPAVAALAGIGVASLPALLRRDNSTGWTAFVVCLAGSIYCAGVYTNVGGVADYFRQSANIAFILAVTVGLSVMLMYFQWRPFKVNVVTVVAVTAASGAIALTAVVSVHNILYPRDDTLGRIGFDMIDVPAGQGPEPDILEQRRQRQGALITAIVRTDTRDLESALAYVEQRRGGQSVPLGHGYLQHRRRDVAADRGSGTATVL